MMSEAVVLFSGGVGSWAAAKRAKERFDEVTLLFTDTKSEDEDLYRFIEEAAENVGAPLVKIADGRDLWELFNEQNFIGNTRVDLCSRILKRELARQWIDERYPKGGNVVLGIDWTESHRFERAIPNWLPHRVIAPLCDEPLLDRDEVFAWLASEDIEAPRLYAWSQHNNCGGFCVKAGQGHFALLLENMPERYAYHEGKEQEFRERTGKDVAILRDRRGGTTKPLTMKDLRERIEREEAVDKNDLGGCGCMSDFE